MIILRNGISVEEYLAQKEYSKLGELVKRTRENLAGRITTSAIKGVNRRDDIIYDHLIKKPTFSDSTKRGVYNTARNNNTRITSLGNLSEASNVPTRNLDEVAIQNSDLLSNKRKKKLAKEKSIMDHKYQILLPRGTKIDQVAHELGHIQMRESKNPITKLLDKKARKFNSTSETRYGAIMEPQGNHKRSGFKNFINDLVNEEALIASEKEASRRGLRILRKSGAKKDELEAAKNNYNLALDTYKGKGRANWKTTLRNTIQIKDKKGGSIFNDKNFEKKAK